MKLHCLGTTGYHPSDTRQTSCYFLPEAGIVLDAGTGMHRLAKFVQTDHLDILLSHTHLDHVIGLTFLLDILHQRPVSEVRVWAESVKLEAIHSHLFSEHMFPINIDVQWNPITAEQSFSLGDAEVFPFPLVHPGGSLGFRIAWDDRSMAYVTDTTASLNASYIEHLKGLDLLMHECNFRSTQQDWAVKTGHSSAALVGQVAAAAAAKQTWLTHINPLETGDDPVGIQDARQHCPGIQVSSDYQVIEF